MGDISWQDVRLNGAGNYDAWIMKLGSLGSVEWQKTYHGTGDDWALSVRQTADEGYIVAGAYTSFRAGDYDAWVMKLEAFVTWFGTRPTAAGIR